jgi:hypothetical protein
MNYSISVEKIDDYPGGKALFHQHSRGVSFSRYYMILTVVTMAKS